MLQHLPVNFIIPPVEPVYNSRPLRHPSRLLLRSSQLYIVAASITQLYFSASQTSLQQPTSKTSQQTATQIRQPDIVAASSSQRYHSASGTSLQQPTSKTSQQTASQIRPTGHCRSLFQSTLSFRQWNQSTTADP